MAIFDNYYKMICDRCKRTDIARANNGSVLDLNKLQTSWRYAHYLDLNGQDIQIILCPQCFEETDKASQGLKNQLEQLLTNKDASEAIIKAYGSTASVESK